MLCEISEVFTSTLVDFGVDDETIKESAPNDLIALTFGGKKLNAAGREYNAYNLIVDKE